MRQRIPGVTLSPMILLLPALAWGQMVELQPSSSPGAVQPASTSVTVTATRGIPSTTTASQITVRITASSSGTVETPALGISFLGTLALVRFAVPARTVSAPEPATVRLVNSPGAPPLQTVLPATMVLLPPPALASVWPATGIPGAAPFIVKIEAVNITLPSNPSAVTLSFGPGIAATLITTGGPVVTARLTIDPSATPGPRTVSIRYGTTSLVMANGFFVTAGLAPTLRVTGGTIEQGQTKTISFRFPGKNLTPSSVFVTNFGPNVSGPADGLAASVSGDRADLSIRAERFATPGGRNAAILVDGEVFVASSPIYVEPTGSVTGISPAAVAQGSEELVTIRGVNTNFIPNLTVVNVTMLNASGVLEGRTFETRVLSATELVARVRIPSNTPPGSYQLYVTAPGAFHLAAQPIEVTAAVPGFCSINPPSLIPGTSGTLFLQSCAGAVSVPALISLPGVTFSASSLLGLSTLGVQYSVPASTSPGLVAGTVAMPGQSTRSFRIPIVAPGPYLSSVCTEFGCLSPPRIQAGQRFALRVRGSGTNFSQGVTTVRFGSVLATAVSVMGPAELLAWFDNPVSSAGNFTLSVITGAQTLTYGPLQVIARTPAVVITPDAVEQGSSMQVTFRAFDGAALPSSCPPIQGVTHGLTCSSYQPAGTTQAAAILTASQYAILGAADFGPLNGAYGTAFVRKGPATITQVSPNAGLPGTTLTITVQGSETGWCGSGCDLPTSLTITSGLTGLNVTNLVVQSATRLMAQLTVPATASAGRYFVTARTGSGGTAYLPEGFTVLTQAPAISSMTPATAQQGQTLDLVFVYSGLPEPISNTDEFTLSGAPSGLTLQSWTRLSTNSIRATVTVAASAPPSIQVVTAVNGVTAAATLLVNPLPGTITGISPPTARQGENVTVTVTGQSTQWSQNATQVNFGAGVNVLSVVVDSPVSLRAAIQVDGTTPTGSRQVTVTTGARIEVDASRFSVVAGLAAISSLNPASGSPGTTLSVQISGAGTHFTQGLTTADFGSGITVNGVTVAGPTSASASITIAAGAALGFRNVTCTTAGEVVLATSAFQVQPGLPVITSITPSSAVLGATVSNIQVTGAYLSGATFAVGGTQLLPATGSSGTLLVGANVLQVSNLTSTSATLRIEFGRVTGAYPLVATTSAGSSASTLTPQNQLVVYQGSGYASGAAVAIVNSTATTLDPSRLNGRYTASHATSIINMRTTTLDPSTRTLNYSTSRAVTVRNQSAPPGVAPSSAAPSNASTGLPHSSAESSLHAATGEETAYAGAALWVQVEIPVGVRIRSVHLYCNGVKLADPLAAPYLAVLTIPHHVPDLEIRAVAVTDQGEQAGPVRRIRVLDGDGADNSPMRIRAVDAAGREPADTEIRIRPFGLDAEHFRFREPVAAMPEIPSDRQPDATGFAAVLRYLPEGSDPLGTGATRDTLTRFRGSIIAPATGTYEFRLTASEGATLRVGGRAVTAETGAVTLEAGKPVDLEVLHYRGAGPAAELHLEWRRAGAANQEFETVRPEFLRAAARPVSRPLPRAATHGDLFATHKQSEDGSSSGGGALSGTLPGVALRAGDTIVIRMTGDSQPSEEQ